MREVFIIFKFVISMVYKNEDNIKNMIKVDNETEV